MRQHGGFGRSQFTGVLVGVALALPARAGECIDSEQLCMEPCPAANSCATDDDCGAGLICVPACLPYRCVCLSSIWQCDRGCAGKCVLPPVPDGKPEYVIIDLGTLGGFTSVGLGINDLGEVVGSADTAAGVRNAFLWRNGTMIDLGRPATVPSDQWTEAWGINNNSQVIVNTAQPAFLWEGGTWTNLGSFIGGSTDAFGVNDAGQVVGRSRASSLGDWQAFLWEGGTMTPIPGVIATAINEVERIVGSRFLLNGDTQVDLGTLGGEITGAWGINDSGEVVGESERISGERVFHAFLWRDGGMIDLGLIVPFESSRAWAISNQGQVVGTGVFPDGSSGFLYHPQDGMRSMQSLLPADARWHAMAPRDVNNHGQIVGSGTSLGGRHAFLMTPLDADFDGDGETDLVDFAAFRGCMHGPGVIVGADCRPYDMDRNGRVDLVDLRAFTWGMNP